MNIALHGNPKHVFIPSFKILLSRVRSIFFSLCTEVIRSFAHRRWEDQLILVGPGLSWFENGKPCLLETLSVLSKLGSWHCIVVQWGCLESKKELGGVKKQIGDEALILIKRNAALGRNQVARRCHQGSCEPHSSPLLRTKLCNLVLRSQCLWGPPPHCPAGK